MQVIFSRYAMAACALIATGFYLAAQSAAEDDPGRVGNSNTCGLAANPTCDRMRMTLLNPIEDVEYLTRATLVAETGTVLTQKQGADAQDEAESARTGQQDEN